MYKLDQYIPITEIILKTYSALIGLILFNLKFLSNQQALYNLLDTQLGVAQSLLSYLHDAQWRLCITCTTLGVQDLSPDNPVSLTISQKVKKKKIRKVLPIDGVHQGVDIYTGTQSSTSCLEQVQATRGWWVPGKMKSWTPNVVDAMHNLH